MNCIPQKNKKPLAIFASWREEKKYISRKVAQNAENKGDFYSDGLFKGRVYIDAIKKAVK